MADPNPYAPPRSRPDPGPRRRSPLSTLLRAVSVVAGFGLIAGPTRPAPDAPRPPGQLAAKGLGAFLLVSAFFPVGWLGAGRRPEDPTPEDL